MSLYHWGSWYRTVYELPMSDRPDDAIIEDDVAVDMWYRNFTRELARQAHAQKTNKPYVSEQQRKATTPSFVKKTNG